MGWILTWIVTTVSLLIIARLNVGVEIKGFGEALIAAIVIGLVNAVLGPIARFLSFPLIILTLGLFALVVNAFLFWLSAAIVPGFTLRNGFVSALIGSILLSLVNMVLFWFVGMIT
jgi:putative membrane protein